MKRKIFRALPLVAAALFVAAVPAKAADWQISTSYSGTTQYSPVITSNPTHLFGNSSYYTTPLGLAPLQSSLLASATGDYYEGFSTISDSIWGNAEQSANYTVTFTIRWVGAAPAPREKKCYFVNIAGIKKNNLPGWTDGLARTTITVSDVTNSLTFPSIVGTGTCTAQFGVGDPASYYRTSQTDIVVNIKGGYGRFRCKVDDYLRYQFGAPATVDTGKFVACSGFLTVFF
jgi:hypothetical protein